MHSTNSATTTTTTLHTTTLPTTTWHFTAATSHYIKRDKCSKAYTMVCL